MTSSIVQVILDAWSEKQKYIVYIISGEKQVSCKAGHYNSIFTEILLCFFVSPTVSTRIT